MSADDTRRLMVVMASAGDTGVSWWTTAGGADPTPQADTDEYALGIRFSLTAPITLTAIRVFNPGTSTRPGRSATVWNWDTATALATVTLPAQLPAGWSTHYLPTPLELGTGVNWMASVQVGGGATGDYAATTNGLNPDVSDGTVVGDRGAYSANPANMPTSGISDTWYGIDVVYRS